MSPQGTHHSILIIPLKKYVVAHLTKHNDVKTLVQPPPPRF